MSRDLSPAEQSTLVEQLRAAGCVFAEAEAGLLISTATSTAELDLLVSRRVSGEPLEHVIGWVEFCGRRVGVMPGVFVPRRRTELLVRQAAARARPGHRVLDLCCGCGAIGLALRAMVERIELHATDIDPAAAACAKANLGPATPVYVGDLFEPVPATLRGQVDLIVANVPYVPSDGVALMPPEARLHEPLAALDGGDDGLRVLRRVASEAPAWLSPGGRVFIEAGEAQVPAALSAFGEAGLDAVSHQDVDLGATVVEGVARAH